MSNAPKVQATAGTYLTWDGTTWALDVDPIHGLDVEATLTAEPYLSRAEDEKVATVEEAEALLDAAYAARPNDSDVAVAFARAARGTQLAPKMLGALVGPAVLEIVWTTLDGVALADAEDAGLDTEALANALDLFRVALAGV